MRTNQSLLAIIAFCLGLVAAPAAAETMNPVVRLAILGSNFVDVELFQDVAPITVANFLGYVGNGSYTNTFFQRSRNQFQPNNPPYTPSSINILQAGGYTLTQTGLAQVPSGPPIPLEVVLSNTAGTIAMARGALPNSATNQWFFNLTNNPGLDPNPDSDGYAVFGRVISGMDLLYEIAGLPTTDLNGTVFGVDTQAPDYNPEAYPFGYVPYFIADEQGNLVRIDSITAVPEPSTWVLAGIGLAAAAFAGRRRLSSPRASARGR